MRRTIIGALALAGALTACGRGGKGATSGGDTLARDLQLAPTDTGAKLNDRPPAAAAAAPSAKGEPAAKKPAPPAKAALTFLAAGTLIEATSRDTITSRHNKAGESMIALVPGDLKDPKGRVVIPGGSAITLRIDTLKSESGKGSHDEAIHLTPVSVEIGGRSYPVSGRVDSVGFILKGRGITGGTAAKVGGGAVIGAVLGRLIGGNKTGTIVGGAAGAAAGAAVADKTGDQDITIYPGSAVMIRLTGAFSK